MTDPIAKGGRGHKAPYETTHVRIAEGIKPVVERLSAVYRQKFFGNTNPDSNGATELIERVEAALSPVTSPVEDYQQVCARYLASLRLGKQAPEYKRAKHHIKVFIQELQMARLSPTPTLKKMNAEALRLLHQEFKNNWLRFFEAISIEPGYFLTFEELLQALEREMAVPYGALESHEKDFLRGWDEIYGLACAEAYRRKNGASPNLNWFEQ
jgi:predicted nucleic acid-binding protein